MTATFEDSSPTYLSARSSDVILSDIRPIKLKVDALRFVNAFLDELLWTILSISRSLSTDRIKASLLKIIPTTLGKEALLEAEVELKAYWERTNPTSNPNAVIAEGEEFPLQWSFELLRFKCEAYSTLNDSDEDINAETRLSERMRELGFTLPPPAVLVAPAALYLTAIIEYMCEHILSNVSRVVARDSSRTTATPHDLFVALCEDGTIYSTFKSMKVYDQIENLLKSSRPQRSKSFSRDKLVTTSRTSSLHSDLSVSVRETTSTQGQSRIRMSSDSLTSGAPAAQTPSRASMERTRMKFFGHARNSSDYGPDSSNGYKKTDSADSMHESLVDSEDQTLKDEFDELMRSGATMKVSLTPDRLKSMEVYNKEKSRRNTRRSTNKRDAGKGNHDEEPPLPDNDAKRSQRVPSLTHVDSIVEDEEDPNTGNSISPKSFPSPHELGQLPTPHSADKNGRSRSQSTSQVLQAAPSILVRKSSWNSSSKLRPPVTQKRDLHGTKQMGSEKPARTRKLQRNIENMDLDEIMNGSDEGTEEPAPPPSSYKNPTRAVTGRKVSSSARELIDFLDEGPPQDAQSARPEITTNPSFSKPKPGPLQRMVRRLAGGSSAERLREEPGTAGKSPLTSPPGTPKWSSPAQQPPYPPTSVSSVKIYPNVIVGTPPRPPRLVQSANPVSPPISPLEEHSSVDERWSPPKTKGARKAVPSFDLPKGESTMLAPPIRLSSRTSRATESKESLNSVSTGPIMTNGHVNGNATNLAPIESRDSPTTTEEGVIVHLKQVPKPQEIRRSAPLLATDRVDELRRLLSNATTADECRVLVDMFLARIGFPVNRVGNTNPYPAPTPDLEYEAVENSVVEMLLSGTAESKSSRLTQVDASEQQINNSLSPDVHSPSEAFKTSQDTQLRQHSPRTLIVA